jgi:hypothetical protein
LGYSKKLENLKYAVALFIWHFNFWNVATNSMTCATYLKNDTGVASRYLTAHNKGGTAFTYHSERFNTRATHIQRCPGQPQGSFDEHRSKQLCETQARPYRNAMDAG